MTNLVISKIKKTLKATGNNYIPYKSYTFANGTHVVNALSLIDSDIVIEFSEWITVYNTLGKVVDCIDSNVSDEVAIFRIALNLAK